MKSLQHVDPQFVQISKAEAAKILGISVAEIDRRRRNDDNFPQAFKEKNTQFSPVRFRLSEVYAYSQLMMERAVPA